MYRQNRYTALFYSSCATLLIRKISRRRGARKRGLLNTTTFKKTTSAGLSMFSEGASGRDDDDCKQEQNRHQGKQEADQQPGAEKNEQQRVEVAKPRIAASFLHHTDHLLRTRVVPSYAGRADTVTNSFPFAHISLNDCRDRGERYGEKGIIIDTGAAGFNFGGLSGLWGQAGHARRNRRDCKRNGYPAGGDHPREIRHPDRAQNRHRAV